MAFHAVSYRPPQNQQTMTGYLAPHSGRPTGFSQRPVAAHESPRTTKLYDRTGDEITLDEVERIVI